MFLFGGAKPSFRLFLLTQRGEVSSDGLQPLVSILVGLRLEKSSDRCATDCNLMTRPPGPSFMKKTDDPRLFLAQNDSQCTCRDHENRLT